MIYFSTHFSCLQFGLWRKMVSASRANVVAIPDMLVLCAISCHAIPAAPNMANARMVHVFVHKDGMDVIALCVSIYILLGE